MISIPFRQDQFLDVIERDEAERRFHEVLDLRPLGPESVALSEALGRVLAADVLAPLDVPSFDRSNVDGYAVRAEDTYGATENTPRTLDLDAQVLAAGDLASRALEAGTAMAVATGGVVPRGADAVVMVEHTDVNERRLFIHRPVVPGGNITFAGTDIGRGEVVLRRGQILTSRETGVLAALGLARFQVVRLPRVAIISTGAELVQPGEPLRAGAIYDSNATVLADAVREAGGVPVPLGIVPDEYAALKSAVHQALAYDMVLLSGGTSKGAGDLSYRVVAELGPPGIVAHGVALKPGKPLCLAAVRVPLSAGDKATDSDRSSEMAERSVPLAVLPGFPTSAIFTFHEFIAPVIRRLAARASDPPSIVQARLPQRVNSEPGRTEYLLVGLVPGLTPAEDRNSAPETGPLLAYPMGSGSGSVTTFGRADGFIIISRQREYLEAGANVDVYLLGQGLRIADLVAIGSHCVGLDYLLGQLREEGFSSKFLAVGSSGGLAAVRRGECDLAGVHLLDPKTGTYNHSFLDRGMVLIPGYRRMQGIVFRHGDDRFEGRAQADVLKHALADAACVVVNRNRGSGTRILIDGLLGDARPAGYWAESRSHNAVAAAVVQGRADWGVAIAAVAAQTGLGFLPLQEEHYDFVVPSSRLDRPAVKAFQALLGQETVRRALATMGFASD